MLAVNLTNHKALFAFLQYKNNVAIFIKSILIREKYQQCIDFKIMYLKNKIKNY